MGYFWNGQSSAQSGAKMSPLSSQYSLNVYDPSPEWCAHVRGWQCSLNTSPGTGRKAAGKQEWRVGCPWMSFLFWKPAAAKEGPRKCGCLWDFLSRESSLLSLVRSPKGCRKDQVPYASIFFLFLDSTFRTSSIQHPSSFQIKPSRMVVFHNALCGFLGFLGPFIGSLWIETIFIIILRQYFPFTWEYNRVFRKL